MPDDYAFTYFKMHLWRSFKRYSKQFIFMKIKVNVTLI